MKAREFELRFDEGEDVTADLDLSKVRRRRSNVTPAARAAV